MIRFNLFSKVRSMSSSGLFKAVKVDYDRIGLMIFVNDDNVYRIHHKKIFSNNLIGLSRTPQRISIKCISLYKLNYLLVTV